MRGDCFLAHCQAIASAPGACQNGRMGQRPTTTLEDLKGLYRRAFAEYGTQALWNKRMLEEPTPEDALVVARALRIEGDRAARRIAEKIESAYRAAV